MKTDNYEDIINLPHHVSINHSQMSIEARASQFAPFAALTGYSEIIKEKARLTENKLELDEQQKTIINNKLKKIKSNIKNKPEITFTYFIHDKNKPGGKYITKTGIVQKIDLIEKSLTLSDKTKIPITEIIEISGNIFNNIQ